MLDLLQIYHLMVRLQPEIFLKHLDQIIDHETLLLLESESLFRFSEQLRMRISRIVELLHDRIDRVVLVLRLEVTELVQVINTKKKFLNLNRILLALHIAEFVVERLHEYIFRGEPRVVELSLNESVKEVYETPVDLHLQEWVLGEELAKILGPGHDQNHAKLP